MSHRIPLKRLLDEVARQAEGVDPRILAALECVPRHLFVQEALRARAYTDDALPIGHGQTITKPSTVARMTAALAPNPEDRVLEVGTGSGYQAAVLSRLVARVYTVERIPVLALRARLALFELGAFNVEVRAGDGSLGWAEEAPFQGILVTAAAAQVPQPLLEQLEIGGRMVLPFGTGQGQKIRRIVRRAESEWEDSVLESCRFVPLVAGEET